ncbi:unnamed protein product [Rhizoctonia solani]|uniref:Uncharacterized protein n=1 Tax=Rhizoctonia solani TaxID=456999 RepID=A0A8H3HWD5_9AGAM|nr:unnamed protein product [Rhizoctonia solani]
MPRPSKRKLALRDNLLKARAKRDQLRALRPSPEGDDVSQQFESIKVDHGTYSDAEVENNDRAETVLHEDSTVAASTARRGPELDECQGMIPEPKLPHENGGMQEHKAQANEGSSTVGWMMHKGPFAKDHRSGDSKCVPVPKDNACRIVDSNQRTEAYTTRPAEQKTKPYLRVYKEIYRASKKLEFSTSDAGTWGAKAGVSFEECYTAAVGV